MKWFYRILGASVLALFLGCGGGSGSTSHHENLIDDAQVNLVEDTNATLETKALARAIEVNTTDDSDAGASVLVIQKSYDANDTDKPLFVNGEFRGIVTSAEKVDDDHTRYTLEDARSVEDAYQNIMLNFSSGADLQRSLRRLSAKTIEGKYDYLNPGNPIQTHFYTRPSTRSGNVEDLILRIDIPKGYVLPAGDHIVKTNLRGTDSYVSCTYDLQSCTAKVEDSIDNKIDLLTNTTIKPSFTITTEGSYLEYTLGGIVELSYTNIDHLPNQPTLAFKLNINGTMDINLAFELKGEASAEIIKEYDITKGFSLEVYHPGSLAAKTAIHFQPRIEFGASASIQGSAKATSRVKRKLVMNIDYLGTSPGVENPLIVQTPEQINGVSILNKHITYQHDTYDMTQSALSVDIEAEAKAWAAPNIGISPEVKFLRVTEPIYLGEFSTRATLEGVIDGKIGASYIIDNHKGEYDNYAEVGVGVNYRFLLDAMFSVKVGDTEFLKTEKQEWFKSEPKSVFDWRIRVMHAPEIEVVEKESKTKEITFKTDIEDENISKKVLFYYTLDGSDPSYESDDKLHGTLWNNTPVSIDATTTVKAIAVLKNRDINDGIWAFGISVSKVAQKEISIDVSINAPTAAPVSGTSFSANEGFKVLLSHDENFPIYYTIDGSNPTQNSTLYTSAITLNTTTTINAIAGKDDRQSTVATFIYYLQELPHATTCSDGTQVYKPTKCYNGEDGCWYKSCQKEVTCPNGGDIKTLSTWTEFYEPHSDTGEQVLDHVIYNQLIQQPGGYWGTCTTRQENWSQNGTLSRATDYEVVKNGGCWYSDGDLCYQACSYYSFYGPPNPNDCPKTLAASSSSSSSSVASSSSSAESSSSSESPFSSSESSSSSSGPMAECGCETPGVTFTLDAESQPDCTGIGFCRSYFSQNALATLPNGTHFGGAAYGYPCSEFIHCP